MTIFCDREFENLMYYKDGEEFGSYFGSLLDKNDGKVKADTFERKKEISDMYWDGSGIKIITKEEAEKIFEKFHMK